MPRCRSSCTSIGLPGACTAPQPAHGIEPQVCPDPVMRSRSSGYSRTPGVISILLVIVAATPNLAVAQSPPLVSVTRVWAGDTGEIPIQELALRLAPILWFSSEEPLFRDGLEGPSALPCDPAGAGRVVYYRASTDTRDRHGRRQYRPATLGLSRPMLRLEYFFYYPQDYGGGCHSNDLESVTMELELQDWGAGPSPRYVVALRSIVGAAHGSPFFANRLDLTRAGAGDTSLPITLLVEEGKHAVAPDRNADGHYTPGYDVNRSLNDAWGVRDIFGSSELGPSAYQSSMTKPRHGRARVRASIELAEAATLWGTSYRSAWWPALPDATYELRELPVACETYEDPLPLPPPRPGCDARSVADFLDEKDIRPRRSQLGRILRFYLEGLKSMRGIYESTDDDSLVRARLGYSSSLPLVDLPLVGGTFSLRQSFILLNWERDGGVNLDEVSLELQTFYSPSISRRFDWYLGGGAGLDLITVDSSSGDVHPTAIAEGGIQFRWQPKLLVGVGIKVDTRRSARLVLEIGRAGVPGFGR